MKLDEVAFFLRVAVQHSSHGLMDTEPQCPRDIINEPGFPINYKRAWFLLGKWTRKGWYDYGVTLDLGWMTEKGMAKAREIAGNVAQSIKGVK